MFFFPKSARLRVPANHADGTVKLQRVRFLKNRARPIAVTVLALPVTVLLLETSEYWLPDDYKKVLQRSRTKAEEEKKPIGNQPERSRTKLPVYGHPPGSSSNVAGKVLGRQDVLLKIPLPIIRQRQPVPYNETDKEWVEASKLMQDPARLAALEKLIVNETIKSWARDNAIFETIKHVSDGRKGRPISRLEVVVPLYRPPQFDMYWLVVLPDGSPRIAAKPLSTTNASRINRIWHPNVFFQAFWNASKVFTYSSYHIAKNKIQGSDPRGTSMSTPLSSALFPQTTVSSTAPSSTKPSAAAGKDFNTTKKEDDQVMALFHQFGKTMMPEQPLTLAKMAFLKTFSVLQVQALQQVPEGAVVFQGNVHWVGRRGKVRSTISAIYLPAADRLICPIIIERSEILPSTAHWHQSDTRPLGRHGPRLANGEVQKAQNISDLEAKLDREAKLLAKLREQSELRIPASDAWFEARRRDIAKRIQKLEDMGGSIAPDAKKVAATRYQLRNLEREKVTDLLNDRFDTEPRLERLIHRIVTSPSSASERDWKELEFYLDESYAAILARDMHRKHDETDEPSSKPQRLSSNKPVDTQAVVEKDVNAKDVGVKNVDDMKNVESGKTEEVASEPIETSRKEKRENE